MAKKTVVEEELDLEDLDDLVDELEISDDEETGGIQVIGEDEPEPEKPKRKRGRPAAEKQPAKSEEVEPERPKKRRGRPPATKKATAPTQAVDPTNPVFLFRAALDNRIRDVRKAGGDVTELERVKNLADLLLG